jgi:hypothetical protein
MGQNNWKLIMGGIFIKVILVIKKKPNLVHLEGHLSNYLVISGKYLIYPLLFIRE